MESYVKQEGMLTESDRHILELRTTFGSLRSTLFGQLDRILEAGTIS